MANRVPLCWRQLRRFHTGRCELFVATVLCDMSFERAQARPRSMLFIARVFGPVLRTSQALSRVQPQLSRSRLLQFGSHRLAGIADAHATQRAAFASRSADVRGLQRWCTNSMTSRAATAVMHMSTASSFGTVLVVESPTKAQKIQTYLGPGYKVTLQLA